MFRTCANMLSHMIALSVYLLVPVKTDFNSASSPGSPGFLNHISISLCLSFSFFNL